MWNKLWNQARLTWMMVAGSKHKRIAAVCKQLEKAKTEAEPPPLDTSDRQLLDQIHAETAVQNRNNLTRTAAYLQLFQAHPELHWALVAHVVSRNGGYGMTDVKGEWFSHVSKPGDDERFFAFLERANWLIFGDAFPQLLLYAEGRRRGKNLSMLLTHLRVSSFMRSIWADFWETRDAELLTRALIINEQNYIEARVLKNPKYSDAVLSSMEYQVQSLLNLNQIVIPFWRGREIRLAGTDVPDFISVESRIETGKRLYRILFQDRLLHKSILYWLNTVPHTGSREDYWPECFSRTRPAKEAERYVPRFSGNPPVGRRIYSPALEHAWSDVQHEKAEPGDWFRDLRYVVHLFDDVAKQPNDFTDEYVQGLRTIEGMLQAKEHITSFLR